MPIVYRAMRSSTKSTKSKSAKPKEPARIVLSRDPKRALAGYGVTDPTAARRRDALLHAVASGATGTRTVRDSMVAVQRRVQVLSVFFKRKNPTYARRAKANAAYLSALRKKLDADAGRAT